jgi:hypothetical protein
MRAARLRSVEEAIASASDQPMQARAFSCRHIAVNKGYPGNDNASCENDGYFEGPWVHNLTTTIANDWLSRLMGMGPSATFATATGAATNVTATTLTAASGFPTAGQGLQGCIVVAWISTTVMVWGIIASNSATVLTIDQWYNATSTTGASGTQPGNTAPYVVLPGNAAAPWMAVSATVHSPVVGDTTLSGELATNGFTRGVGTYAHSTSATTYTLALLWTASGTETIINEASFAAANTTAGGYMPFESAEPNSPTLVSGDTLTNTATITV